LILLKFCADQVTLTSRKRRTPILPGRPLRALPGLSANACSPPFAVVAWIGLPPLFVVGVCINRIGTDQSMAATSAIRPRPQSSARAALMNSSPSRTYRASMASPACPVCERKDQPLTESECIPTSEWRRLSSAVERIPAIGADARNEAIMRPIRTIAKKEQD